MKTHNENIKDQFNLRASTFDQSVHWVRDPQLIAAHVRLAGKSVGRAVELCCGTGAVARALHAAGWDVTGVDLSEGMVKEASKHVKAVVGDVAHLPFEDQTVDLVVMRQAYFLLDNGPAALAEVRRILKPSGRFILSHLVPYGDIDRVYLKKVHACKQAQMKTFHTTESLIEDLRRMEFTVLDKDFVTVRESVSLWMREAPELTAETRQAVCELVVNAPEDYKKLRNVQVVRGEILENWNFVLLLASPRIL
jgi:ubiquinone/menaquinone biosynthesis C-methylase UbiE